MNWISLLTNSPIEASAPCRVDMGGTVDLGTFYYPLGHLSPCTVNIALDLRTRVTLAPYRPGRIRIKSRGFDTAEFDLDQAPFDHPMGLMFAVAAYFCASGVDVGIESASPPRSALGGSSTAAVALVGAFSRALVIAGKADRISRERVVRLSHGIESAVAGVPCGMQDQLAAAYGGVNGWYWRQDTGTGAPWRQETLWEPSRHADLSRCLLLAYCGAPHESKDINGKWVRQFISGKTRETWRRIIACTHDFSHALAGNDLERAVAAMNRETALRLEMTPEVLDATGQDLLTEALGAGCAARFTGAGGGGCVWALGEPEAVDRLRPVWDRRLQKTPDACLIPVGIDSGGIITSVCP